MSKTISDQVNKTELLISGLRDNMDIAANAGLTSQQIAELEAETNALKSDNQEVERLLEQAKPIARIAVGKLVGVRTKFIDVKRKIKQHTDPTKWASVGILDKR
jgi:hypothetical protein